MKQVFFTVGEIAQREHAPVWKVRRVVDSLCRNLPRAGLYRLVPLDLLPAIRERLSEQTAAAKDAAATLAQELRDKGCNINTGDKLLQGAVQ